MRKHLLLPVVLVAVLALVGCSEDRGLAPTESGDVSSILDPQAIAVELATETGWPIQDDQYAGPVGSCVTPIDCEDLGGGIVHYNYRLRTGEGPYDEIGLHRVVREARPGRPIRTRKAVFLQHGDAVAFEGVFLFGSRSPNVPDDHSIAYYLASNDVDVWGIDQNWTLVPQAETDFSFMADWGMQNQIENLDLAMSVARFVRLMTNSGPGKMHLLGYSSGSWTGYAYLNMETQKKEHDRNVLGYIPLEAAYKGDDPTAQATICYFSQIYQGMHDGGQYQDMVLFSTIGYLAMTDPDGDSPLAPGYSNRLVALLYGSATHLFAPFTPWYHYLAGAFDPATGMPTGFQFVTEQAWLDFLMTSASWEPTLFYADYLGISCGTPDSPFDDYLGQVSVPIFNVGVGGALGPLSEYTLSLIGSTDVTSLIVSFYPPEYAAADFGHIDALIADNAEGLVWQPILAWIEDHTPRNYGQEIAGKDDF
jgi:hypothetical protein